MNAAIRDIITDLKAAVRIGHPDSIQAALEGLRALPEVASNQTLSDDFLAKVLLPLGEILSNPRLPMDIIDPLRQDSSTAMRALAAITLSLRYQQGGDLKPELLTRLANDSRSDVRAALVIGLSYPSGGHQEQVTVLAAEWLNSDLIRLQQTALQLIANLSSTKSEDFISWLAPFGLSSNPDTNADLVAALDHLAQNGQAHRVLSLLEDWAQAIQPNSWVISRNLSASWAAAEVDSALNILHQLALKDAPPKQIVNALQALVRHGAGEVVQNEITLWNVDDHENLRAIAQKIIE